MSSIADVDAGQALVGLAHAIDTLSELDAQSLTQGDRLAVLRGAEALIRRIPAAIHPIVNELVAEHVPGQFGGANLADVLADTLRITRSDARRRIRDAAELAPTFFPEWRTDRAGARGDRRGTTSGCRGT